MTNQTVHIGSWIDWNATSPASRHILTLSSTSGALFNNALLLLITFVGTRFWFIITFIIHRRGKHDTRRDGLRRMVEVILRNQSALSAFGYIVKASSAWKGAAPLRSRWIARVMALLAILNVLAWAGAGLAETLVIVGPIVQASSNRCGYYLPDLTLESETSNLIRDWTLDLTRAAQLHISTCTKPGSSNCGRLISPIVDFQLTHNATCPFGNGLCSEGPRSALNIDTGNISSADLGFNIPKPFTVRHTMQCSPIKSIGNVYNVSWAALSTGEYASEYLYYGPFQTSSGPLQDPAGNDATFQYNQALIIYQKGYILSSESWSIADRADDGTLRWSPISALLSSPSDSSIYFLSAGTLAYPTTQNDPWFRTDSVYPFALQPVSVLACLEQRQFCNPSNGRCDTPATSRISASNSTVLGWDNLQADAVKVLDRITFPFFPISYLVDNRGASLLLADAQTTNGRSTNLSSEQWKLEVVNFMNIALAGLKMAIVRFGTGEQQQGPGYQRFLADSEVCKRRMIKFRDDTGRYTSYSLSGILIIIFVGLAIIVLSFLVEPIFERLARTSTGSMREKYEAWKQDELLMLYTASMERIGVGPWVMGKYDIPISAPGVLMLESGGGMPAARPELVVGKSEPIPLGQNHAHNGFSRGTHYT
ncbi:hypothetical protein TWF730_007343 [Orbilia blumenaviensis]|uniref:Uncharacterized protein n=1 Tax=Orbilia blumenaviensis TaxID=1796055 RepID=A0AAV9VA92_9PEZI